jgi:hypothetical protein
MSKANSANDKGNSPAGNKETPMSFHKIAPVKKHHKAAPVAKRRPAEPAPVAKKAVAPKRRPVGRQGQ